MIIVRWSTLQPVGYGDALRSYYIDNAIYSLAHPERQSIHLAVLAGTNAPPWLMASPGKPFPDTFGSGTCDPATGGPPSKGKPGTIWSSFAFVGGHTPMPNPFGSNTCLWSALDSLVEKLGHSGDYYRPAGSSYPKPLAPYDDLYYDSAPGGSGFVHTDHPTATMNKIIGHVSALGPHSYDAESVLCEVESECASVTKDPNNAYNYTLWTSLQSNDKLMEAGIEDAQKKAIDIYARHFPNTFFTVDLVQRQMPFFTDGDTGCDGGSCFDRLRMHLIDYIRATYAAHGGVQNNSLAPHPDEVDSHPVWREVAAAAQGPVRLFAGFQVTAPKSFYPKGRETFTELQADDQAAVDLAKQLQPGYSGVDFIEFYDVEISNVFTIPEVTGGRSGRSRTVNSPRSAINDAGGAGNGSGFMYKPLTDAHLHVRGMLWSPPKVLPTPPIVPKCPPGATCPPPI